MNDAELQSFFSGTPVEPGESWPRHSLPAFCWVEGEYTVIEISIYLSSDCLTCRDYSIWGFEEWNCKCCSSWSWYLISFLQGLLMGNLCWCTIYGNNIYWGICIWYFNSILYVTWFDWKHLLYSHWFTGTQNVEQVHRVVGPSGNARKKAR